MANNIRILTIRLAVSVDSLPEAVERLRTAHPTLAVTDVMTPGGFVGAIDEASPAEFENFCRVNCQQDARLEQILATADKLMGQLFYRLLEGKLDPTNAIDRSKFAIKDVVANLVTAVVRTEALLAEYGPEIFYLLEEWRTQLAGRLVAYNQLYEQSAHS